MAIVTNTSVNSASIVNTELSSSGLTWDEADFSWDDAVGDWNNPYGITNSAVNSASITNSPDS